MSNADLIVRLAMAERERDEAREQARMHESLWREAEEASAATARERDEALAQRDELLAGDNATIERLTRERDAAEAQRDECRQAYTRMRGQRAKARNSLRELSRYKAPAYETDDCHEHADAAEAVIVEMAGIALAGLEET